MNIDLPVKDFPQKPPLPIFLAVTIAAFSQLSAINADIYYTMTLFSSAGLGAISGGMEAVVIGATNLIFTTLEATLEKQEPMKEIDWFAVYQNWAKQTNNYAVHSTDNVYEIISAIKPLIDE